MNKKNQEPGSSTSAPTPASQQLDLTDHIAAILADPTAPVGLHDKIVDTLTGYYDNRSLRHPHTIRLALAAQRSDEQEALRKEAKL